MYYNSVRATQVCSVRANVHIILQTSQHIEMESPLLIGTMKKPGLHSPTAFSGGLCSGEWQVINIYLVLS
jgi:hypothetical protein